MASSRENGLAKPQTRLLYAVCACNYLLLPLARQHKPSIFVSRFAPSRHFFTIKSIRNAFVLFSTRKKTHEKLDWRAF